MRKLTIINQQYPPEVAATGQIFQAMAAYLQAHGWQVTVVPGTPFYPGTTDKAPRRETEPSGVRVHRLWSTTFEKGSTMGKLANMVTYQLSLLGYCLFRIGREETVLVATAPPLAVVSTAVGRFFRRFRYVMTVQDLYPDVLAAAKGRSVRDKFSWRLLKGIMRRAMRRAAAVIAIGTDMRDHLCAAYGLSEVSIIPNLFPQRIRPVDAKAAKAARGLADRMVVQYSGNFGVAHEYDTLLAAARILHAQAAKIVFQVTGDGRNYRLLKAACEAEGLSNVIFGPYAPLAELQEHLGTADISVVIFDDAFQNVLLPSKYYGILASGRGVLLISGAKSDIRRDIERTGCGLVVPHGDGAGLAAALQHLQASPDALRAMGERARTLFDAEYTMERNLAAYDRVLGEAARARR